MKKTLLKGLTVITLLVCLVMALAGCNDGKDDFKEEKPTLNDYKYSIEKTLITSAEQTEAETFLTSFVDNFKKPFENKDKQLLTMGGMLAVNAKDATNGNFTFDENNKVYVDFDVQLALDKAQTANKSQIYLTAVVGGTSTPNTDTKKMVVELYYDAAGDGNALVAVNKVSPTKISFNEKIKVGSVDSLVSLLNALGINASNSEAIDIYAKLGEIIDSTELFSDYTKGIDFVNNQLKPVIARLLYGKNADDSLKPLFEKNGNTYSLNNITSSNFNEAVKAFFKRAGDIYNDANYNPLIDYHDANNNNAPLKKKTEDGLNNNSDQFFKEHELLELALSMAGEGERIKNPANWATDFAILPSDAVNASISFTTTATGFNNGNIKFLAKKGTKVQMPGETKGTYKYSNELTHDINFEISNLSVETTNFPANKLVDVSADETLNAINQKQAQNVGNMSFTGKISSGTTVYDYAIDADIDLFKLMTITEKTDAATVKAAFEKFSFVVTDNDGEKYKAVWENEQINVYVNGALQSAKSKTAANIANKIVSLADKKEVGMKQITSMFGKIKTMMQTLQNGKISIDDKVMDGFIKDIFENATSAEMSFDQGSFKFNGVKVSE